MTQYEIYVERALRTSHCIQCGNVLDTDGTRTAHLLNTVPLGTETLSTNDVGGLDVPRGGGGGHGTP